MRGPRRTGTAALTEDRRLGALLGLAIGDALGATTEFTRPGPRPWSRLLTGPHIDLTGGGTHDVLPGMVTDDTQMACCLADSVRACGGYDPVDACRRYIAWVDRAFDAGAQTIATLRMAAHMPPLEAGWAYWRDMDRRPAGNGSLMRIAPIGVLIHDVQARRSASLVDSSLTHADPRCLLACACFTAAIAAGIRGVAPSDMLAVASNELKPAQQATIQLWPEECAAVEQAARDLRQDLTAAANDPGFDSWLPVDGKAMGFVRIAFRLAFWELLHASTPAAGLIDIVNRGGDADTNAAIAGALLGSCYGAKQLPETWIDLVLSVDPPLPWNRNGHYHPAKLLSVLGG